MTTVKDFISHLSAFPDDFRVMVSRVEADSGETYDVEDDVCGVREGDDGEVVIY